ncbi:MAG: Omp28-related outer membrane protein [Crocinitomicaceae bacterium]
MKNLLVLVCMLIFGTSTSNAQILFEEDFQGASLAGFTITDIDGLTVASSVSQFTDAWIVAPDATNSSNLTAQSTSSYSPAGTSDDWMSTPAISLGPSGNLLSWLGRAYFPNSDGYEVWVNASGPTPSEMLTGTMIFDVASEENVNTLRTANLDAFAGQTIYIGFRNNSTDGYILLIDDIKVEVVPIVDAEMVAITNKAYHPASSLATINFDIKNTGITPISAFTAEWTDGTNTYQQTFPTNISPLEVVSFSFNDLLTVNSDVVYPLTASIVSVNGTVDNNQANNSTSTTLSGMTFIPEKLVVGEEATGTWCGWCPRGWDYMDFMDVNYPENWVGIAVHNNDPMTDAIYDTGMNTKIDGYPSGLVDRALVNIDPSEFEVAYTERITQVPPAAISVSSNQIGNNIEVAVTAEFAATLSIDYRLNCVVVENEIQDNTYDQVNYYNAGGEPLAGYGYEWSAMANPVFGSDLVYQHVARTILGGWDGQSNSVPTSVTSGQQVTYTWTYPIPAESEVNNMVFVGMLIDQTTGEILNAGRNNITNDLGLPEETAGFNLRVFPNPFTSYANIALELQEVSEVMMEITTMTGQVVEKIYYGSVSGETLLTLNSKNLESGTYFVHVLVNGQKITKKLTLVK